MTLVTIDTLRGILGKSVLNGRHDPLEKLARSIFYEKEAGLSFETIADWHGISRFDAADLYRWGDGFIKSLKHAQNVIEKAKM